MRLYGDKVGMRAVMGVAGLVQKIILSNQDYSRYWITYSNLKIQFRTQVEDTISSVHVQLAPP